MWSNSYPEVLTDELVRLSVESGRGQLLRGLGALVKQDRKQSGGAALFGPGHLHPGGFRPADQWLKEPAQFVSGQRNQKCCGNRPRRNQAPLRGLENSGLLCWRAPGEEYNASPEF